MKKLAVLCIAACATVLGVGQPARADWRPYVRNVKGIPFYYDENYTHPMSNPRAIIARLMEQGHAPYYLIFSCFTTRGGMSPETNSSDSSTLSYTQISTADTNGTVDSVFRVQYCQGQVRRNTEIMGNMNTRGQFMNEMIKAVPTWGH